MKATKLFPCSAAVLVALIITTLNSPAPIFMKYDGVDGEANAPGITNGVELLSFSAGHSRSNTAPLPVLKDLVITKTLDKSSPKLAEACASGQHFTKVELLCRKAGSTGTNNYYTVTLEDCFISSYSVSSGGSGSGGGGEPLPTESISFNYTKIEWRYEKQDPAGVPTEPPVIGRWPPGSPVP